MRTISIGKQDFASLREKGCFYVDKTAFIKEWWESEDDTTLITRPRRFGKTLNMSMLECFFSYKYKGRSDLFEGLYIWEYKKYREIQGTYPVLFLTFADVKQASQEEAITGIKENITNLYNQYGFLLKDGFLNDKEKKQFQSVEPDMADAVAQKAVRNLACYLERYYGKKVIILLDEYDTPLQEAYIHGYWDGMAAFIRGFFNAVFKTNPHMERAIMTGITRTSQESMFSDLNHMAVITTASVPYATVFGFTEKEVFASMEEAGMQDMNEEVRKWYDGFTFGNQRDIYNPWSVTNFMKYKELSAYWADTSSNGLVNKLIQKGAADIKISMEELLHGKSIKVNIDEQVIFNNLGKKKNAIWSLLLAGGYLKIEYIGKGDERGRRFYELSLTNKEVHLMFESMIHDWFETPEADCSDFTKAMVSGDLEAMNYYMDKVALTTFSFFDTGDKPSGQAEPERFYHGFVLGLMVDKREDYIITSNRESGLGRYDVLMEPRSYIENSLPAIIMEFKVFNPKKEKNLEETVQAAHKQIEEKNYDSILLGKGIPQDRIRHYGFAFKGKNVYIG